MMCLKYFMIISCCILLNQENTKIKNKFLSRVNNCGLVYNQPEGFHFMNNRSKKLVLNKDLVLNDTYFLESEKENVMIGIYLYDINDSVNTVNDMFFMDLIRSMKNFKDGKEISGEKVSFYSFEKAEKFNAFGGGEYKFGLKDNYYNNYDTCKLRFLMDINGTQIFVFYFYSNMETKELETIMSKTENVIRFEKLE